MSAHDKDPAQAAYDGYARATGGRTFDGRQMPKWSELPPRIQRAWRAALFAYEEHKARVALGIPDRAEGDASETFTEAFDRVGAGDKE